MGRGFRYTLKRLRRQAGLSQGQLARACAVPQSYISALESGARRNPSFTVLKRVAKALGVTLPELIEAGEGLR